MTSTASAESGPRRRTARWAAVALVLLVVVALLGWRGVAAHTLDAVTVAISGHDCRGDGTTVRARPGVVRVETARDLRCTFTVEVVNRGARAVHLGEVRASVLGPRTGAVVTAETIDGVAPTEDPGSVDAVHSLGRELPANRTVSFDVVVVFRPEGCNQGGTLLLGRFPRVDVSTLGATRTVEGASDLAFHNDLRTPGCSRLGSIPRGPDDDRPSSNR